MKKANLPVLGMGCAGCAARIEKGVRGLAGVQEANVNFAANTLGVTFDEKQISLPDLKKHVASIGYDLLIDEELQAQQQEEAMRAMYLSLRRRTIVAWVLVIPLMAMAMGTMHGGLTTNLLQLALAIPVIFYCGRGFYIHAWRQARQRTANMDTLVALSTGIAFAFSLFNTIWPGFWTSRGVEPHVYYEASGAIIAFVLLGKMLEERAKNSTSTAIRKLMGLQPKTAHLIVDGVEKVVPITSIKTGDSISVKPGEKIPVDGTVTGGSSYVDESMISGEPMAVRKEAGSRVLAGTLNTNGEFTLKATEVGSATMLSRIVGMVQEAQGSKAPVQRLADRISAVFVPTIIVISAVTFLVWMIFGGHHAFSYALLSAISVLVIACPCALGLATPTALMVGIGKGAEEHILIKDAFALENLCRVDSVVLDKTGTLTQGHPAVVGAEWSIDPDPALSGILYGAEQRSEHPLSEAITSWLKSEGVTPAEVDSFDSLTGRGIAVRAGGEEFWIGSLRLAQERDMPFSAAQQYDIERWQQAGETIIFFGRGRQLLMTLRIVDPLKDGSARAVAELQKRGIAVHILSGDNSNTVKAVAARLGITHVLAEALPQDKEDYVASLQQEGHVVAMVGDGINDSQALARADVSVAMGKGTDIAMEVAMVTLMNSDLELLPRAITLSRRTVGTIRQNLFWAFIYNVIGIPIAAGALYPFFGLLLNPMWASAAMAFSSVSVVLNSLRLKFR